ncbi:hypothetical protein HMPREF0494_0807 [Limosilactobacillus antri DSM 16041]|uniref:Uncharacterized protein n=1 Tax=Limosilactobacillus antri DSM 16041 TaxID=525309 RepID=C8P663_9LACO|nr:hypothetical protein HMPREF0494_0807 [Limosilactobacillus antri DSM 16041]
MIQTTFSQPMIRIVGVNKLGSETNRETEIRMISFLNGSNVEVGIDFVFRRVASLWGAPASANRVSEFGFTEHWNPFAYCAVRILSK